MSALLRVVFDTSSLVGAALKVGTVPHRALSLALQQCQVCVSTATLAELDAVLSRDKFDRYLPQTTRLALAALLRLHAHHVDVTAADDALLQPPCRDPKDNKFLALAQIRTADMLVATCTTGWCLSMPPAMPSTPPPGVSWPGPAPC